MNNKIRFALSGGGLGTGPVHYPNELATAVRIAQVYLIYMFACVRVQVIMRMVGG